MTPVIRLPVVAIRAKHLDFDRPFGRIAPAQVTGLLRAGIALLQRNTPVWPDLQLGDYQVDGAILWMRADAGLVDASRPGAHGRGTLTIGSVQRLRKLRHKLG